MQSKGELDLFRCISNELEVVFDVGTRDDIDYYLIKKECEYHLFEPNIKSLKSLENKINTLESRIPENITINKFGLSNENFDDVVYYENTESYIPHWQGISVDNGQHKYSLKTLDDYIDSKSIKKIDFLKIDCEELDYRIIVGGLKNIKYNNNVSFIQIEFTWITPIIELLTNFDFYLMLESGLQKVLNELTNNNHEELFSKSLVKLDTDLSRFIDLNLKKTGAGGNIFGINKNKQIDINKLIFDIVDDDVDSFTYEKIYSYII
jgi:FkbM family methyltransferase